MTTQRKTIFSLNEIRQMDNIEFWTFQFSEHALFIYLGIVDIDSATKEIREVSHRWYEYFVNFRENYLTKNNKNSLIEELKKEALKFKNFKEIVLARVESEWSGWLYPTFLSHILHELNYFLEKEFKKISNEEIIKFWNQINGEHSAFTVGLLDPREQDLIKQAMDFEDKFLKLNARHDNHDNHDLVQFKLLSQHMSEEMDKFTQTGQKAVHENKILSIIHPLLIDHVRREGQRSIVELESIFKKVA